MMKLMPTKPYTPLTPSWADFLTSTTGMPEVNPMIATTASSSSKVSLRRSSMLASGMGGVVGVEPVHDLRLQLQQRLQRIDAQHAGFACGHFQRRELAVYQAGGEEMQRCARRDARLRLLAADVHEDEAQTRRGFAQALAVGLLERGASKH